MSFYNWHPIQTSSSPPSTLFFLFSLFSYSCIGSNKRLLFKYGSWVVVWRAGSINLLNLGPAVLTSSHTFLAFSISSSAEHQTLCMLSSTHSLSWPSHPSIPFLEHFWRKRRENRLLFTFFGDCWFRLSTNNHRVAPTLGNKPALVPNVSLSWVGLFAFLVSLLFQLLIDGSENKGASGALHQ